MLCLQLQSTSSKSTRQSAYYYCVDLERNGYQAVKELELTLALGGSYDRCKPQDLYRAMDLVQLDFPPVWRYTRPSLGSFRHGERNSWLC
jgi:hypothetical protein